MTLFVHEWKQSRKMLLIWTAVVAGMTFIFMLIFPQMAGQMEDMTDIYANLGSFSAAFGMDKINFATPLGFYGIEAGAMISIGGGMLAALLSGNILCKEEGGHTAELLFTMPHRRTSISLWKALAAGTMIAAFNLVCVLAGIGAFACIGEELMWKEFLLYHTAQLLMQLEIGMLCFCISAFWHRTSMGVGIGVAMTFYFLQMFVNITDKAAFLKYFTPYYYADASNILPTATIEWKFVALGMVYGILAFVGGVYYYARKDLR